MTGFQDPGLAITTAERLAPAILHATMIDAFSDYAIPMRPTLAQFEAMLRQRSFDPSLTSIALKDGRPVPCG